MTFDNISTQYQNYRRIALIVVHCSATRCDRDFPVARILGHRELSSRIRKDCPCFRAAWEYWEL